MSDIDTRERVIAVVAGYAQCWEDQVGLDSTRQTLGLGTGRLADDHLRVRIDREFGIAVLPNDFDEWVMMADLVALVCRVRDL